VCANASKIKQPIKLPVLGECIYYIWSGGTQYPHGTNLLTQTARVSEGKSARNVLNMPDIMLKYLLLRMLDHNPEKRPRIQEVYRHPCLISFADKDRMLKNIYQHNNDPNRRPWSPVVATLLQVENHPAYKKEWYTLQLPVVRERIAFKSKLQFNTDTQRPFPIPEFIRVGIEHSFEWPSNVKQEMLDNRWQTPEGYFFEHTSCAWFLALYYECSWDLIRESKNTITQVGDDEEENTGQQKN